MTTLLSRTVTASCHNASLLQYSPGNDLQVDPETDYLEGPAMVQQATILLVLVPRLGALKMQEWYWYSSV